MRNEIIFRNLDILIEIHEKHQKMKDDTDILKCGNYSLIQF